MKWYIHRILILFCSLFAMGVIFDNTGVATIYACDLEDDDDYWQFDNDGDDWWTYLPDIDCTPDPPTSDDTDDDLTPNWDIDDTENDWDGDPCEMGDCDDLYDDTADKDISKEEIEENDCDPETGIKGSARRAKGKDECVQDCMGVLGGKAYTKVCNGETICIDGNNGTFTNTLTGEALEKFEQAEQEMLQNCLQAALLNSLNENYGIQIDYSASQRTPGSFNPCNYSIVFNSASGISATSVTAELFHAYQEQYLEGLLSTIQNSADHKGGANIEAEEKAMGYLTSLYSFYNMKVDSTLLYSWCEHFFDSHQGHHTDISLTQDEIDDWFAAVEQFIQYNNDIKTSGDNDLYDAPIDNDLLPVSLLDLWNNVDPDCVRQEIVVGKKIISSNIPIRRIK